MKMNIPSSWIAWFLAVWAVLFGYAVVSRLLRLKGKPGGLIEPPPEDIVFDERFAGARSHKSLFTRFGGGTSCMRISITKKALLVRPHFPFSLVGADSDLIHEIPLSAISDITQVAIAGTPAIAVRFATPVGECRVDLVLKRPMDFLSVLSSCCQDRKELNRSPAPAENVARQSLGE